MARKRITKLTEPGDKPGMFGNKKEYNDRVSERAQQEQHNRLVDEADKLISRLPKRMQGEAVRGIIDGTIDIKEFVTNPAVLRNTAIAGGGVAALAGLGGLTKAYADQANEYGPTDPIAVTGRALQNLGGGGSVGADPLAAARNNVAQARQLVGSEAMLEALAIDEVAALRAEQRAAATPTAGSFDGNVQQMIDFRAAELMQTPIQRADGSVAPMPYDTAMRMATEQVHMALRAEQVY